MVMCLGPAGHLQKDRLCHLSLCSNKQLRSGAVLHECYMGACSSTSCLRAVEQTVEAHCMYCPAEDEVGGKRKLEDAAIEAAKRPRTDGQPPFLPGSTHRCLYMSGIAMPVAQRSGENGLSSAGTLPHLCFV